MTGAQASWRKSSHSFAYGNCVEVAFRASSHSGGTNCVEVGWRKSSLCGDANCVEVADGCGLVHVRDSKDPDGGKLSFTPAEWREFLASLTV